MDLPLRPPAMTKRAIGVSVTREGRGKRLPLVCEQASRGVVKVCKWKRQRKKRGKRTRHGKGEEESDGDEARKMERDDFPTPTTRASTCSSFKQF